MSLMLLIYKMFLTPTMIADIQKVTNRNFLYSHYISSSSNFLPHPFLVLYSHLSLKSHSHGLPQREREREREPVRDGLKEAKSCLQKHSASDSSLQKSSNVLILEKKRLQKKEEGEWGLILRTRGNMECLGFHWHETEAFRERGRLKLL